MGMRPTPTRSPGISCGRRTLYESIPKVKRATNTVAKRPVRWNRSRVPQTNCVCWNASLLTTGFDEDDFGMGRFVVYGVRRRRGIRQAC